MLNWWLLLDLPMRIIWVTAILSTAFFLYQVSIAFARLNWKVETYDDLVEKSNRKQKVFNLLNIKNLFAFLAGFSWLVIFLYQTSITHGWLLLLSLLGGLIVVFFAAYGRMLIMSYNRSRKIPTSATVGCDGLVFLSIPPQRQGAGMVQVKIKNAILEYDAQTDGETIIDGSTVHVIKVLSKNTLLVEPIDKK